jgi:hypothetical protein
LSPDIRARFPPDFHFWELPDIGPLLRLDSHPIFKHRLIFARFLTRFSPDSHPIFKPDFSLDSHSIFKHRPILTRFSNITRFSPDFQARFLTRFSPDFQTSPDSHSIFKHHPILTRFLTRFSLDFQTSPDSHSIFKHHPILTRFSSPISHSILTRFSNIARFSLDFQTSPDSHPIFKPDFSLDSHSILKHHPILTRFSNISLDSHTSPDFSPIITMYDQARYLTPHSLSQCRVLMGCPSAGCSLCPLAHYSSAHPTSLVHHSPHTPSHTLPGPQGVPQHLRCHQIHPPPLPPPPLCHPPLPPFCLRG